MDTYVINNYLEEWKKIAEEKGWSEVSLHFSLPSPYLTINFRRNGLYVSKRVWPKLTDLPSGFAEMQDWITLEPSAKDAAKADFHVRLLGLIELSREAGIDDDWINPLTVMAQRLATNALPLAQQLDDEIPF